MRSALFFKKAAPPDPELRTLKAELRDAQGGLIQAYQQFNQAVDPDLVESCIYQISSMRARCNFLLRAIKARQLPSTAPADKENPSWN